MTSSALTRPGERDRLSVKFGQIDWALTVVICLIATASGLMLYSIAGGHWTPWAASQMALFGLCLVMMLGLAMVDLRVWFTLAYPLYAVIGHVHFQPSELMKIALVLALARFYHGLSAHNARLSWWLLIPAAMIAVPVLLIDKQPDLGTAVLLAATGATVVILAGLSLRLIGLFAVAVVPAAVVYYKFLMKGYQHDRILTFLHPESDPSGKGYHILQAKIALGSGGILGKGFELGSQSQLNFLPEKQTDFIFAALAEEFGLLGCVSVLLLYGAAVIIALRIANVSHSHFGRLSAVGVTATFALYVLFNGASVMGLAPVVGVPMPLLSYGGTGMLTVMAAFGLIQAVRVHRYTEVTSGKGAVL
jgi:rod shape determining protein RodA